MLGACGGEPAASAPPLAGCPSRTGEIPAPASAGDLYSVAEAAYACPGHVLHLVDEGDTAGHGREVWVDVIDDAARLERLDPAIGTERQVLLDQALHFTGVIGPGYADMFIAMSVGPPREPTACVGGSAALAFVLPCPSADDATEERHDTLEPGTRDGRAVLVLTVETVATHSNEGGSRVTSTQRIYLDQTTLLPVAREDEAEVDWFNGGRDKTSRRAEIAAAFVPVDALPPWIFQPTSMGYPPEGPAVALEAMGTAMAVHWLGPQWAPGQHLPTLNLSSVTPAIPGQEEGMLEYSDQNGDVMVTLEHVQKPDFDRVMRKGWEESLRICGEPIPVADGGVLTAYCDVHDPASEAAAGMVEFPDGLVLVAGPSAAIEAIGKSLAAA